MRLGNILLSILAFAVIASAGTRTSAPSTRACAIGAPTAASSTWDFKGEAIAIFKDVELDAHQAMDHAEELQTLEGDPNVSREAHEEHLAEMKTEINDIEARLCRLETIRRVVSPWQQHVIDQIAATGQLMVDNAQDAIALCNHNPAELKLPTYWRYTRNLYDESASLTHSLSDAVKFAGVSKEYRTLGQEVGARKTS